MIARWYVVETLGVEDLRWSGRSRCDAQAVERVEKLGVEVYAPHQARTVISGRRRTRILEPLFPGYFFACFAPTDETVQAIKRTRFVRAVFAGAPVSESVMASVRLAEGVELLKGEAYTTLKPGDEVRIGAGLLAGEVGELARLDPRGRVRVLIYMLGQKVAIEDDFADLALEKA